MNRNIFLILGVVLASLLVFGCAQRETQVTAPLTNQTGENQIIDLKNMDYSQLKALNKPVRCEVKMPETDTEMVLYLMGEKIRIEYEVPMGTAVYESKTIVSGNAGYQYVQGIQPGMQMPCDWAKFDRTSPCVMTEDTFQTLPATSFDCQTGEFGDEKFTPTGKICDMSDKTSMDSNIVAGFFPCMLNVSSAR